MARTIFDPAARDALLERLAGLTPDAKAQWGTMTAPQMVCHLADSLRVGMGDVPTRSTKGPLANPVARWLLAYVVPFPKGKAKTAPEMLLTQPSNWRDDLSTARELLLAAARRGPDGTWAVHPAFGTVSGKLYGVFIHKHFDHHLRQFGR